VTQMEWMDRSDWTALTFAVVCAIGAAVLAFV
jgi:hypothetical protein